MDSNQHTSSAPFPHQPFQFQFQPLQFPNAQHFPNAQQFPNVQQFRFPMQQSTVGVESNVFNPSVVTSVPVSSQSINGQFSVSPVVSTAATASSTVTATPNLGAINKKSASSSKKSAAPMVNNEPVSNVCLAYIRSLMLRNNQHYVIENTAKNFLEPEIEFARKALYLHSGCKNYKVATLHDPATPQQRRSHCAASIVKKIEDLEKTQSLPRIVCEADDLFRIMNINNNSTVLADKSVEDRLSSLEKDVTALKSSHSGSGFPPLSTAYVDISTRQNLINKVSQQQTAFRNRSGSASKRIRSQDEEAENPKKRRAPVFFGSRDDDHHKSTLGGPVLHDVFLFNYRTDVDDAKVRQHFQDVGVKVVFFRKISKDEHYIKNYLMKIPVKDDFQKIIDNLPPRTGARWFVQDSNPRDQPSFFNKNMATAQSSGLTTPSRLHSGDSQHSERHFTPGRSTPSKQTSYGNPNIEKLFTSVRSTPVTSHSVSKLINSSPSVFSSVMNKTDDASATSTSKEPDVMDADIPKSASAAVIPTSNRFEALSNLSSPDFAIGGPVSLSNHSLVLEDDPKNTS